MGLATYFKYIAEESTGSLGTSTHLYAPRKSGDLIHVANVERDALAASLNPGFRRIFVTLARLMVGRGGPEWAKRIVKGLAARLDTVRTSTQRLGGEVDGTLGLEPPNTVFNFGYLGVLLGVFASLRTQGTARRVLDCEALQGGGQTEGSPDFDSGLNEGNVPTRSRLVKLPPLSIRSPHATSGTDEAKAETCATPVLNAMPHPALLGAQMGLRQPQKSSGFLGRIASSMRGPVAAVLLGASLLAAPGTALGAQDSIAQPPPAVVATYVGQTVQLGAQIADVAEGYVEQMQTESLAKLRPEALFDQVESGKLTVQFPLRAGTYRIAGTKVHVDPGTVVVATAEIKDGKLVPYAKGEGTRIQLTKPLRGPVWTTAHGVYLKSTAGGQGKAMIDVAGWFDQAGTKAGDLQVSGLIRGLLDAGDTQSTAAGASEMVDWSNLQFQLDPVTMGEGIVDLGGMKLDLAAGTNLHIVGDKDHAQVTAHFAIDGAQIRQSNLQMDVGAASADLQLTSEYNDSGQLRVQGSLLNLNGDLTHFVGTQQGAGGTNAKLDIRDLTVSNGRVDFATQIMGAPNPQANSYRFRGDIKGKIADSRVVLPDAEGTVSLDFSAASVGGHIDASEQRIALNATLTGADLTVEGFQPDREGSTFDLRKGNFQGDLAMTFDTADSTYNVHAKATSMNVVLDDLKGNGATSVDLGRTQITGSGEVDVGSNGLKIEGDIAVSGRIDDLKVRAGEGKEVIFDVAAGSTFEGSLRSLEVGKNTPLRLNAQAAVALGLDDHGVEMPGFEAHGPTQIKGSTQLDISEAGVHFSDANLIASMSIADGKVNAGDGVLSLDVADNSKLSLAIKDAAFGGNRIGPQLELGPGSILEGRLDGGHLDIAGRRVAFDPGTLVRFDMSSLEHHPTKGTSLIGSLLIDAPVQMNPLAPQETLTGLIGTGGAGLRIDGVRFQDNGQLTLKGIDLDFEGSLGTVERVAPQRDQARLGTLLAANPDLKTQQDLINYFFQVGGGDWAGADRTANGYGLNLKELTKNREAFVHAATSNISAPAGEVLASAIDLPSIEQVSKAHAGEMLGIHAPYEAMDLTQLAKSIDNGRLLFSIPLEGDLDGVTFEPGTKLFVSANATDGNLDADSFKASLSKPGDATAWATLDGAYLDDDRNLMLDIGGWFDRKVEGFENLPTDISQLVERIMNPAAAAGDGPDITNIADMSKAQLVLKDVTFKKGHLPFQVGHMDLQEGTKVTIVGTQSEVLIRGVLKTDALVIDSENFAMDTRNASTQFSGVFKTNEDGSTTSKITFEGAKLMSKGLVYRDADGQIAQLGEGQLNGKVVLNVTSSEEAGISVSTDVKLTSFEGNVQALRMQIGTSGGQPSWLSLGPSHYSGPFHLTQDGGVSLNGHASQLDASITNLEVQTSMGKVQLDEARLVGAGLLGIDGESMSFSGGPLSGAVRFTTGDIKVGDAFPGYLKDIMAVDGSATFQFSLDEVARISHDPATPFVLEGAKGKLDGRVTIDEIKSSIAADPFNSGVR